MWIMSSGAARAPLMTEWDTVTDTYWGCVIRAARPTCHIGYEGRVKEDRGDNGNSKREEKVYREKERK